MKIENKIFGSVEVTEPPLVDLVNSPPLQRLKGVHNGGPCQYIHQNLEQMTRFNHSVGVMLLLRHFGAGLTEQLAGLLHDVSHTAFSHLADYVFGGDVYKLDYQDNILGEFILKSEIPEILARHGLAVEKVQDPHGFTLLEQEIPDLCADRLEYSLAHPMMARHLAPLSAQNILAHVVVEDHKFVMNSAAVAWKYARAFLSWYTLELAGPRCVAAHQILADAIKRALTIGALVKEDMFGTDEQVLRKLRAANDPHIIQLISALTPEFDCVIDELHPDLKSGVKFRYIDPLVQTKNGLIRVSQLYPDFGRELLEQKEKFHLQQFPLRIISKVQQPQLAGII